MIARLLNGTAGAVLVLAWGWLPARAESCMAQWSCGASTQCAAAMGGSSGQQGPFSSRSACVAWANQYNRNTSCDCSGGTSASSSTVPAARHAAPRGPSPQDQVNAKFLEIGTTLVVNAIIDSMASVGPERAPPSRSADDRSRTAARARLVTQLKGFGSNDPSPEPLQEISALSAPPPSALLHPKQVKPPHEAYVIGERHGRDCLPANAAAACVNASSKDLAQCVERYRDGYRVGQIRAEQILRVAYNNGKADKQAERKANPLRYPTGETCGVRRAEAYNTGFKGNPFTMVGR